MNLRTNRKISVKHNQTLFKYDYIIQSTQIVIRTKTQTTFKIRCDKVQLCSLCESPYDITIVVTKQNL